MILRFSEWLAETPWSIALHESLYGYAIVESVHVWSLCGFLSMAVLVDVRLLGLALRDVPVSTVIRRILPWSKAGFVVMVITVVALFWFLQKTRTGKAMRAYSDNEDLALLSAQNLFHVQLCDLAGQAREWATDGIEKNTKQGGMQYVLIPKDRAPVFKLVQEQVATAWAKRAGPQPTEDWNRVLAPIAGFRIP